MPTASKSYAFLSYSHKDEPAAKELVAAMRARGLHVWRDVDEIDPGTRWQQALEQGLQGANAILYLASRNTGNSKWIAYELGAFLAHGRLVIPIILDDYGPQAIPESLRAVQWLDARRGIEHVVEPLAQVLALAVSQEPQPLPAEPQKNKGYVFLSYAEDDEDFLQVLRPFLKDHGYAYWDFRESDRDYHGQFTFELEQIIIDAVATLSVLSDAWRASKWTLREYLFSEDVKKPVVLLRAKPIQPTLAIAGVPYIDFVVSVTAGVEKLDRELRRKGL